MFRTVERHEYNESHSHCCLLAATVRLHGCSDVSVVDDTQEEHDRTRPEEYRHSVTSGTREINSVRTLSDQASCL